MSSVGDEVIIETFDVASLKHDAISHVVSIINRPKSVEFSGTTSPIRRHDVLDCAQRATAGQVVLSWSITQSNRSLFTRGHKDADFILVIAAGGLGTAILTCARHLHIFHPCSSQPCFHI